MTTKFETLTVKILKLEKQLRAISRQYAADPMEADDIFSEIIEKILTKSVPEISPAMILTKAKWIAIDHTNSHKIYQRYIGCEDEAGIAINGEYTHEIQDGELEIHPHQSTTLSYDTGNNPETILIEKESSNELARAVEQLSPTLQLVVSLLARGYKPVEISDKMAISKSAVSQDITRIQKSLRIIINA